MPVAPPLPQARGAHAAAAPRPTNAEWLGVVWLLGFLAVLSRILLGLLGAMRLTRRSSPVASAAVAEATEEARWKLGLRKPPSVREGGPTAPVAVPMTFGVLRPVVLLPEGAGGWPAERLRVVMTHELAHVGRRDWTTATLSRFVCALYWFHPLVWLAAHHLRVEGEQACDDLVLNSGVRAVEYADHLVEVVRGLVGRRVPPAVVTMAYRHEVMGRLKTILAECRNRRAVGRRGLSLAASATAVLLVPLAVIRPVSSIPSETPARGVGQNGAPIKVWAMNSHGAMMAGHSKWDVALPNGIRVRLLAAVVTLPDGSVECAWTPDGVTTIPLNTQLVRNYGPGPCQFQCGIVFPSARLQNGATVSGGEAGGAQGWTEGVPPWHHGQAVSVNIWPNSPNAWAGHWAGQGHGALQLTVASGSKATLIAEAPTGGAARRLPTGELLTLSRPVVHEWPALHHQVATTEVTASVPSRFVRQLTDYGFEVIGQDGRPIRVQHAGTSEPDTSKEMTRISFDFRTSEAPLDRVKEIRLMYRPSQSVTFRNVALRPRITASSNEALKPLTSYAAVDASPLLPNSIGTPPGDTGEVLPPRIASALAGGAAWKRTLPSGIKVKMVSVTSLNAQYQPGESWKPDGKPLGTGGMTPFNLAPPPHLSYQFLVVSPTEAMMHEACLAYGRAGNVGRTEGVGWRRQRWAVLNYPESEAAPQPQQHVALQVSVSTGPETTLVSGSPMTGAVRRLPTGETVVLSKAILHSPGEAHQDGHPVDTTEVDFTLPTRFVHDLSEYRFMIIGQDGKPLSAQHGGGGVPIVSGRTAQMRYDFRSAEVPLARVKEFRLTFRPSETAIFKDFAVRPNHAAPSPTGTSSASSGAISPPVPDLAKSPPAVATAGEARVTKGVSLQLMAVSDKPSDVHRWWRPDGTPFTYNWRQFRSRFEPSHQQTPFQQWPVLMFRVSQPAGGDADVNAWDSPAPPRSSGHVSVAQYVCEFDHLGQGGGMKAGFASLLAAQPGSLAVRMRVEAGPWRQAQVWDHQGAASLLEYRGTARWGTYDVRRLSDAATSVTITSSTGNKAEAVRLVAFDGSGRQYLPQPLPGAMALDAWRHGTQSKYALAVPMTRIRKLVLETRPYRYVEFRGIAGQPKLAAGAQPGRPVQTTAHVIQSVAPPTENSPTPDPTVRRRTEDALSLREHLRGWALQNAPLIRQMRRARPDDLTALFRAYPQVPLPGQYPGDPRTGQGRAAAFTALSAPLTLSHLRNSQEAFAQRLRQDFTKYQDFRLSESANTGRSHVTLWASGRVTETTLTDRVMGHGQPILTGHVESVDLAPPYEFLFPQSSF